MSPDLFAYSSTHRIDEIGPNRLLKDLRRASRIGSAPWVEPAPADDPTREPSVYRALLTPAAIGPRCVDSGAAWVLLERIDAPVLWQVGEVRAWIAVAAWIAGMHRRLRAHDVTGLPLVVHDAAHFAEWRDRARAADVPGTVLAAHTRASRRLVELTPTVVHGELYASNLLVRVHPGGRVQVWPVDWERTGLGPAVLDVAALTAGDGLAPADRTAMARAYFEAAGHADREWRAWCHDLDAARLHQCVQWLAASSHWEPPVEHRQDWLAQATELAAAL